MKVIIAGSRGIDELNEVIIALHRSKFTVTEVVSGGARGVDKLGEQWADTWATDIHRFPVTNDDWKKHPRTAGFIRNAAMADYADALVAVWDGESGGTRDMIQRMRLMSKPTYVHFVFGQAALDPRQ